MKDKFLAYLFLILVGYLGIHRFYLNKIGTGIIYLLTGGLFGFGIIYDFFCLSGMVDKYNKKELNSNII